MRSSAAGGNADAIARAIGNEIAKPLGQAVMVEVQSRDPGRREAGPWMIIADEIAPGGLYEYCILSSTCKI